MRLIPTRIHGPADYVIGVLLVISPWLFGFSAAPVAKWLVIILGAGVLLYSLLTDYEWSIGKILPMPIHLWLDGLGGALLLVSPWLFGFYAAVWIPHVVLGALEIAAALTTETRVATRQCGPRSL